MRPRGGPTCACCRGHRLGAIWRVRSGGWDRADGIGRTGSGGRDRAGAIGRTATSERRLPGCFRGRCNPCRRSCIRPTPIAPWADNASCPRRGGLAPLRCEPLATGMQLMRTIRSEAFGGFRSGGSANRAKSALHRAAAERSFPSHAPGKPAGVLPSRGSSAEPLERQPLRRGRLEQVNAAPSRSSKPVTWRCPGDLHHIPRRVADVLGAGVSPVQRFHSRRICSVEGSLRSRPQRSSVGWRLSRTPRASWVPS